MIVSLLLGARGAAGTACSDEWAKDLKYMGEKGKACTLGAAQPGDGDADCSCSDLDGKSQCDAAYRLTNDGTYARCETVQGCFGLYVQAAIRSIAMPLARQLMQTAS